MCLRIYNAHIYLVLYLPTLWTGGNKLLLCWLSHICGHCYYYYYIVILLAICFVSNRWSLIDIDIYLDPTDHNFTISWGEYCSSVQCSISSNVFIINNNIIINNKIIITSFNCERPKEQNLSYLWQSIIPDIQNALIC